MLDKPIHSHGTPNQPSSLTTSRRDFFKVAAKAFSLMPERADDAWSRPSSPPPSPKRRPTRRACMRERMDVAAKTNPVSHVEAICCNEVVLIERLAVPRRNRNQIKICCELNEGGSANPGSMDCPETTSAVMPFDQLFVARGGM